MVRKNIHSVYDNEIEDKELIINHLDERVKLAEALPNTPIGTKNLVYFTIFSSENYLKVLDYCLQGINKFTTNKNFDLLFITQESFVPKIQAMTCIKNFNYNFLILSDIKDPVEASMKKLRVFDYENINQYKKILFLDCDVLPISPIDGLFEKPIDQNCIEVASNPEVSAKTFLDGVYFFTLDYLDDKRRDFINKNSPIPFNAGHFMFVNSERMKQHFKNVVWFSAAWPGEYFFEQSFMNYYFSLQGYCSKNILHGNVGFVNVRYVSEESYKEIPKTTSRFIKTPDGKIIYKVEKAKIIINMERVEQEIGVCDISKYSFIHFIGCPGQGIAKFEYVKKFIELKNICL